MWYNHIQGDVVGVYNSTGTKVVTFTYDAFGRCTVSGDTTLAEYCRIRYRGYYYDTRTGLYWVQTRYYNPDWCRWISPDSVSYLDTETPHGINLYLYCGNDPINYVDPTGQFVITLSMILTAVGIGAAIGAGIGIGTSVAKDLENGQLFDGDVSALSYIGNALGGGIAGAGIGLCSVLGAGLGLSIAAGTTLVLGGTAISAGTALAVGVGGAFVAGGLGYVVRTGISDQESFELSDMFIEAGANAISGFLTFFSSFVGGYGGIKTPGATSFKNSLTYHACVFGSGMYALKALIAYVKQILKENF